MRKPYTKINEDLSPRAKSAIADLECSREASKSCLAQHLKIVSISGGDQASDDFLLLEAKEVKRAAEEFMKEMGWEKRLQQVALDSPLSEKRQRDLVAHNQGKVDEIVVMGIGQFVQARGTSDILLAISRKVIGRDGLQEVNYELVDVVDEHYVALRVVGWIPNSDFDVSTDY